MAQEGTHIPQIWQSENWTSGDYQIFYKTRTTTHPSYQLLRPTCNAVNDDWSWCQDCHYSCSSPENSTTQSNVHWGWLHPGSTQLWTVQDMDQPQWCPFSSSNHWRDQHQRVARGCQTPWLILYKNGFWNQHRSKRWYFSTKKCSSSPWYINIWTSSEGE